MPRKYTKKSIKSTTNIYHCDGGAFVEPPHYIFHDAYFSVVDDNGRLIKFDKELGDMWSGLAEFHAIKWAIENIPQRPITITSDCTTAISWVKKGGNLRTKKIIVPAIEANMEGVEIIYKHGNAADIWNAQNHSPKHDKQYYIDRWRKTTSTKPTTIKKRAAARKKMMAEIRTLTKAFIDSIEKNE